ncbi:MAG: hypothetical protein J4A00_09555, partial [Gammaproteobacteria bacterium]|nr:hypothetical protein [Gammaproteobacteria bacterium]
YPMFTALLADYRVPQRLLKLPDGARRLTNLRHLAELMQAESRRHTGDIHAEYDWFADQRRDAKQQRENRKLRLESDEKLVQIMTVHGSKGLQFPVVFVPFLWTSEGTDREGEGSYYHPGEQGPAGLGAVLDLRPIADQERDVVAQAELERWSESLRLLYVALTRAEHRCYFSWALAGKSRGNIGCSAAAWLLHAGGQAQESLSDFITRVQGMSAEEGLRQLSDLAAGSARGISVVEPAYDDQVSAAPGTGAAAVGLARVARRALAPGGGITSFTALQRSGGAVHLSPHQFSGVDTLEPTQVPESPIMDFPRGAVAGNCLHQILESVDYRFDPGEIRGEVERGLVHYGFGPEWSEVVTHGIHDVLRTPLLAGCNLTLAAVEERVNELEFRYPLASRIAGDLAMGAGENPDQQAVAGLFSRLPQVGWPGYMKGYIDLLFQYEGRYYLADFKSNWLGLCYSDYAPPRLTASMDREGYRLQYLLYSLALHRLLRWRLPDYDYQAHFGGVFYLYLRGMSPERGPANGVWFRRPSSAVIETLERQFGE